MVLNEIKKNVNGVTRDGFECLKYGLQWLQPVLSENPITSAP